MADRYKAGKDEKRRLAAGEEKEKHEIYEYSAMEIFRTLMKEKQGEGPKNDKDHSDKVQKMKGFIKDTMKTDQIDKVDMEELKKQVEGEGMLARMKYRR